nr:allene oxide synthase-lipoxygenase protein-like [Lytechinus pictus]
MGTGISKATTKHTLYVKTGDRIGMGTDATVSVAFYNDKGHRSRQFKLNRIFHDDLRTGHMDKIQVGLENSFGYPVCIELTRNNVGLGAAWFCEFIQIVNTKTKKEHTFPVDRWVNPNPPIKLKEYDTVLPQDDENKAQRQNELQRKKDLYVPIINQMTGTLTYKDLPPDENFTIRSTFHLLANGVKLLGEAALMNITLDNWTSLKEIEEIYREPHFPVPMGVQCWRSDKEFGNQRLAGCNPAMIRRCTSIPVNFAVDEKELEPLIEGLTIQEAIDQKRLFIIDYKFLQGLPCTENREICAPLALFFVNKEKYLMPIAIQINQDPAPDNPVFYPTDPEYTWLMAKCYFNLADSSVHESASHLGFTHLFGETVVIATHRYLSQSHPIFRLLAPHFLYLLAINSKAMSDLIGEGGFADENMNIGRIGMAEIVKLASATWRLNVEGSLHADLEDRGVSDPEVLPNYHYRDDAILLHRAIHGYVEEVVGHHYDTPEKIANDYELQEWAWFLGGQPKCDGEITAGLKGFPNGGQLKTSKEITMVVTDLIFLLSAGHAAVNFGQYDNFGFPPAYPAWLNGKPPQDKTALCEKDIIDKLASKKQTLQTMAITKLLSTRDNNPIGDFELQYLYHPADLEALDRFRAELKRIGTIIDERNKTREEKYLWLHPSEVPNSISI